MKTIILAFGLLIASTANAETDCDKAALARAEANVVTAEGILYRAMGPREGAIARQLVRASVEQYRAIKALCNLQPLIAKDSPFEETEVTAEQDPAWCAVMNDCP